MPWQGGLLQQAKGNVLRLEAVMDANSRFIDYKFPPDKQPQTPQT